MQTANAGATGRSGMIVISTGTASVGTSGGLKIGTGTFGICIDCCTLLFVSLYDFLLIHMYSFLSFVTCDVFSKFRCIHQR